jgi:flagellar basal body rod protein FlgF
VNSDGSPITSYQPIASGGAGVPGGNVNDVQINDGAGGFAGNGRFQYDAANTKLTLSGFEVLSNIGTAPAAVANSVAIYNNAPGAGATGLYTVGTTTTADEVISLTRARLYAIIF